MSFNRVRGLYPYTVNTELIFSLLSLTSQVYFYCILRAALLYIWKLELNNLVVGDKNILPSYWLYNAELKQKLFEMNCDLYPGPKCVLPGSLYTKPSRNVYF